MDRCSTISRDNLGGRPALPARLPPAAGFFTRAFAVPRVALRGAAVAPGFAPAFALAPVFAFGFDFGFDLELDCDFADPAVLEPVLAFARVVAAVDADDALPFGLLLLADMNNARSL